MSAQGAAAISGGALFVVYLATLAPTVTLWDSGEFLAAARTLGIPHPPGTPLFIFGVRVWAMLFGWLPFALAVNLASAASAALAAGLLAWLVTRWTGRAAAGAAGALVGGGMAAVWQSATETEVYSHATLAVVLSLVAAELAGVRRSPRHRAMVAFLFGMAVPLHLSILVAGPAVILLAATDSDGVPALRSALVPAGAWAVAMGLGTVSRTPLLAGALLLLLSTVMAGDERQRVTRREGVVALLLTLLGASFVLVMLVRAQHDPAVNEGNPTHWQALLDVIARRQYDVPPIWPRRAPLWLQIGNVVQYSDWQVASALSDSPGASLWRTPVTVIFAVLAVVGSLWHRARDRRSWNVLVLLLLCATGGVVVVLNLRAGPSFGWGVLLDGALREARERDYFFALAFLLVGVWSGCGIVQIMERARGTWRRVGWLLVATPLVLNWRLVDRRRLPDAHLARDVAAALLREVPPDAVLILAGDNDTFPLWFAQHVEGVRPDVTPVTIPLLGAGWYRGELVRRDALLDSERATLWAGLSETLAEIGREGVRRGRPVIAAVSVSPEDRRALDPAAGWRLHGMWYSAMRTSGLSIDSGAVARAARWWVDRQGVEGTRVDMHVDAREPAGRYLERLLSCPAVAERHLAGSELARDALLESICNFR